MNGARMTRVVVLVLAGTVGTVLHLRLAPWLGEEVVALAAINVVGWFLLGLASGRWGERVEGLRCALLALGLTGFTSITSLLVDGPGSAGEVVVAGLEVAFGLMFAGVGHLVTMPRGPDL